MVAIAMTRGDLHEHSQIDMSLDEKEARWGNVMCVPPPPLMITGGLHALSATIPLNDRTPAPPGAVFDDR